MASLSSAEREAFIETLLEHVHRYLDHSPDRAILMLKVLQLMWRLLETNQKADLSIMFGRVDRRTGQPIPLKECVRVLMLGVPDWGRGPLKP